MSHAWVQTANGDLLRADEIRYIGVTDGLSAVLVSGERFLLADAGDGEVHVALAKELAAAMAAVHPSETAVAVCVEATPAGSRIRVLPLGTAAAREG